MGLKTLDWVSDEQVTALSIYFVFDEKSKRYDISGGQKLGYDNMQLEKTHIRSWNDLANTFLKQYKYNQDMVPNRMQLQNLSQKKEELFKEYAQTWREMASRVQPPLLDKDLLDMFMRTLQGPYY